MIELKNVTTVTENGETGLKNYSRIVKNGEFCRLGLEEGSLVISALVGFHTIESGFITFDGMPLSSHSVSFLRKLMAYVPSPEGFVEEKDLTAKQQKMMEKAIGSDADILLAMNPTSHQDELQSASIMNRLRQRVDDERIVIVACDNNNM